MSEELREVGMDMASVVADLDRRRRERGADFVQEKCRHCLAPEPDAGCDSGMVLVPDQDAYTRCPRAVEHDARMRIERRFEAAGIDMQHRHLTFERFAPVSRDAGVVAQRVSAWTQDAGEGAGGRGILIHGAVGVGKTHLAYAALNVLVERGADAIAIRNSRLLQAIKDTWSRDPDRESRARDRLDLIMEAPILLIDDIGKSAASEWVQSEMHDILTERIASGVTLVTTNHSPDGELALRIGESSESRLHEMCEVVHLPGQDYRRRQRGEWA